MARSPVSSTSGNPEGGFPKPLRSPTESDESILGRGARVRGRISGEGSLRIEGSVEGDVAVSGDLTIDEGASVVGDVGAASLVIVGELKGDVEARGPVAIRAGANVEGNLTGSEISLDEGASFRGQISAEFDLPAELLEEGMHAAQAGRGRDARASGAGRTRR